MSIVRATCTRVRRRAASTPSWPSSAVRAAAAARSASGDKAPSAPRTAHRTPRAETGQQPLIDRRHAWRRPVRTCVRVTHARLGRMSRARTAHGRAGGHDARAACSLADDAQRVGRRARGLLTGDETMHISTCMCTRTYPRPTACASAKLPVHRGRSRRHALAFLCASSFVVHIVTKIQIISVCYCLPYLSVCIIIFLRSHVMS